MCGGQIRGDFLARPEVEGFTDRAAPRVKRNGLAQLPVARAE
jgi:hypothetical protein